jgi:hypothetical protein
MYDIKHITCGEVAFRVMEKPKRDDVVRAHDVRLLDGSTPLPCENIICGSCGQHVRLYEFTPVDGFADDYTLVC